MALTGPFSVTYPVNFYSGGDTTKEAFGKHIQEIQKIYGILNSLNSDKVSADELTSKLQAHINDSNPHPNLNLANISGSLPFSKITGNLDATRITGTLSNAYIDKSRVNGLESYVTGLIPADKGFGITQYDFSNNGYVKFSNTFLIQWGYYEYTVSGNDNEKQKYVSFPTAFGTRCFSISLTIAEQSSDADYRKNLFFQLIHDKTTKNGFYFYPQYADEVGDYQKPVRCYYIAIGC